MSFYVGWMRGTLLGRLLHYKVKEAFTYRVLQSPLMDQKVTMLE